jgi:carboxyl-terminal processing protease
VRKRLLGEKGSSVEVGIYRRGVSGIRTYTIIRDKIPVNSLDASYMIDNKIGYVKLNKFGATTEKEFSGAINGLLEENMKHLIIDLRGNTGGYLEAAIRLSDHFFSEKKLIVYLEGLKTPRQNLSSRGSGDLSDSRIVILVDEGSASASEILAGAVQDYDRGVVVGRRTFGKGLVQNGFYMQDGSMVRLTIARYYTPTGRLIQRPYEDGLEKYIQDYFKRFSNGELLSADSITFPDSLKYKTLVNKRDVFGGGGIMPDIFVPVDTSWYSNYYRNLISKNVITEFTLDYVDQNRNSLTRKYTSFEKFKNDFSLSQKDINSFIKKAEKLGVEYNEEQYLVSKTQLVKVLQGLIARDLWDMSEYYETVNINDPSLLRAIEVISDRNIYNSILKNN